MEPLNPASAQAARRGERSTTDRTMDVDLPSQGFAHRNSQSRDSNEAPGMSLSESESDENSVSSIPPRTGSPREPTVHRNRLFRRRKTTRSREATITDSDRPRPPSSSTPNRQTDKQTRRGLFRRRRSPANGVGIDGDPRRRWRRPTHGVGMSLSDTESRPLRSSRATARNRGVASQRGLGLTRNGKGSTSVDRRLNEVSGRNGGGAIGKEALLYPEAQPLQRLRSHGQAEEISRDPTFSSPIPLAGSIGSVETDRTSSRGHVRYGDYVRLWGYSSYEQKAGYVGYLRRTTRKRNSTGKGELFVLPPVPPTPPSIFNEACFKIVAPQAEKEDGDLLYFGEAISLVDDRGMVWNNKDGRFHGRLGPSLFGNGGHMQLKFLKRADSSANGASQTTAVVSPENPSKPLGNVEKGNVEKGNGDVAEAISYGDTCELVAKKIRPHREGVVRAPVTHHRRRRQIQLGGYLRSDGKGFPCTFTLHHAPPRISMVTVYAFSAEGTVTDTHSHYKIPWNQELEFELPVEVDSGRGTGNGYDEPESQDDEDDSSLAVLRVNLSNGGEMSLRVRDVKMCVGKTVWFGVMGLPDPFSILAQSRRQTEAGLEDKDKNTVSIELLTLGGVLVAFSITKALAARAPRLFFAWELPIALEISLDVLVSLLMLVVVVRQKGLPAALSRRADRSTSSVKYVIKLIKCESGAAQDKPAGEDSGELEGDIPPMPDSFMLAECGDHDKAYARWKVTVKWRQESGANVALATPHPRFDVIKKQYPTYFHGKDKTGAVIYYEQLGKIEEEGLRRAELDSKQMLWHYMYQMEYLWSVINPVDSDRVTTVLDLKGVSLATAAKAEIMVFIKQAITMMSTHYPERSRHVILISLPRWFDWIFRFVRPMLTESTKSKISSCSANVYQTLLFKIDNDQIPREYGGASVHGLGEHPYEVGMRENALKVLAKHNMTMETLEEQTSASGARPGQSRSS